MNIPLNHHLGWTKPWAVDILRRPKIEGEKWRARHGWWMVNAEVISWSLVHVRNVFGMNGREGWCAMSMEVWRCMHIYIYIHTYIYVPYMGGTPIAWRFTMDNPIKMDDFEVPPFMETPVYMVFLCILLELSVFAHCSWKRANAGIYMVHGRCQALRIQCPQLQDPSPSRFG